MGKLSSAFDKSDAEGKNEGEKENVSSPVLGPRAELTKAMSRIEKAPGSEGFFENDKWDVRLRMTTDPHSPYFESFRRLRTAVLNPTRGRKSRTILVTSVAPHEGKGFVCANLGVAIGRDLEHYGLVLDCDFRHPSLAGLFGLSNNTGLVDHLKEGIDLSLLIRKTGQPKLSVLPCGKPPPNPSELLTSSRMAALVEEISRRYEDRVILFDSPPHNVASETGIMAKHLDGVILVVRHGASKRAHVKKFVESVGPEKIIGVVYNAYPENMLESLVGKSLGYGYDYSGYGSK